MAKHYWLEQTFQDYVNGTESERLRFERSGCEPGAYEHVRVFGRWDAEKSRQLRLTALRIIADPQHVSDHHGDWSELARENCGYCALHGYGEHTDSGALAPNYAGWARIYVQSGERIPAKYREAFEIEANAPDGNQSYSDALGRDIATFGVRFTDSAEVDC